MARGRRTIDTGLQPGASAEPGASADSILYGNPGPRTVLHGSAADSVNLDSLPTNEEFRQTRWVQVLEKKMSGGEVAARLLKHDLQTFFLLDKDDDLSIREHTESKSYVLQDGNQLTEFVVERDGNTMTIWLIMMHDWQLLRQDLIRRIEIDGKMYGWSQTLQELAAGLGLGLRAGAGR